MPEVAQMDQTDLIPLLAACEFTLTHWDHGFIPHMKENAPADDLGQEAWAAWVADEKEKKQQLENAAAKLLTISQTLDYMQARMQLDALLSQVGKALSEMLDESVQRHPAGKKRARKG